MSEDNSYIGSFAAADGGAGAFSAGNNRDSTDNGEQDQQVMPTPTAPQPPEKQPVPKPQSAFRAADLMRLVERYMSEAGTNKVYDAFLMAAEKHDGALRADKVTPYITHPLEVAHNLAQLYLDEDTLCAALLHDVLEDTTCPREEIADKFGETVAVLVEGVTKLKRNDELPTKEAVTIASFHKMMQAMTKDFRVVLIKLADRLHNMQTLGNMPPEKRRRIAHETATTYVALARRLGMNDIRRKLQWLVFQNLYAWRSQILQKALDTYQAEHEAEHQKLFDSIEQALQAAIPRSNTMKWDKNLFRVYEQCRRKRVKFRQQCDLLEISVQVGEISECYQAMGVIHGMFRPRMGSVRDFIAAPRAFGFQALQTTVTAKNGQVIRFQIQTRDMFHMAQFGMASCWRYPDARSSQKAEYTQSVFQSWVERVKDFDSQAQNPDEFYADMQADMFQTEIYAYTPAGEVKEFPRGATLVDFAYAVHTEVGHRCVGALVDGKSMPLRTRIPNDMATIRILMGKTARPQLGWLNFVKTSSAHSAIRSWLRQHGELPVRGEREAGQKMSANIVVDVRDVKGMLRQITKSLDGLDVNIVDLKIIGEGRIKQDAFTLQVDDASHLQEVIRQLKLIPNVLNVYKSTKKDSNE
ncbi:MAG TPA: HD domain-containing protein [Candidatus Thiothrix moscowensis]|uniref:RelA/SpoT family protein n=1 Tax=unclassified Thiothrix TaxID=2636184 RepID=UPI0025EC1D84|nr:MULTISPECIES: HD domain-containing protein [unclassified Thiothrix]HRJ54104.1 HD domain-containing protein [Candidatus Thiothrix moscowensis]HRJ94250.1 HD domain-containing protein [Candidatus Thiothrix moscowensis]